MDDKGNDVKPYHSIVKGQYEYYEDDSDVEGIYKWLREMENYFPSMPAFEVMTTFMKPVCIESVIDPLMYHYFSLESAVSEYGIDALYLPKNLFEVFETIRGASNTYENLQNFKTEMELKNKQMNKR